MNLCECWLKLIFLWPAMHIFDHIWIYEDFNLMNGCVQDSLTLNQKLCGSNTEYYNLMVI